MKKTNYIALFVWIVASVQLFITISASPYIGFIVKLDLDKDGQITIKETVQTLPY
jgi:ABC-type uncharacterized transport system permease subunit